MIPLMLAASVSTSYAAGVPLPSRYDSRITSIEYIEDDVVEVSAAAGIVTSIVFETGEVILDLGRDVQAGFPEGWTFFANGNILYIKPIQIGEQEPLVGRWSTNVEVVTSLGRLYSFNISLADDGDLARPAFRVRFKYSDSIQLKAKADHESKVEQAEVLALKDEPLIPEGRHYDLQMTEGAVDIKPDVVFDNGEEIFMRFPVGRKIPAFFYLGTKGQDKKQKETIANPRADTRKIRGDTTDQSRSTILAVDKNRGSGEIMLRSDELAIRVSPKE